jgi:hypothetical protein
MYLFDFAREGLENVRIYGQIALVESKGSTDRVDPRAPVRALKQVDSALNCSTALRNCWAFPSG